MHEEDKLSLLAILEAIGKIEKFSSSFHSAEEFQNDIKSFDACLMNFLVIGEMTLRLNIDFIEKHNDIEWHKVRAFRNLIAHDYLGIDVEKVWDIIKNKVPELKSKINQWLTPS